MSSGGLFHFSFDSSDWSAEQRCYTLKTKRSLTVKINLVLNFNLDSPIYDFTLKFHILGNPFLFLAKDRQITFY